MKVLRIPLFLLFICFSIGFASAQKTKNVSINLKDGKLVGTLLTVSKDKTQPIVLIVPGSGTVDRNGNAGFVQSNTYLFLANELAKNGIGSLRYDKLWAGESRAKVEEKNYRYQDDINHVVAWFNLLQKYGYTNIIIAGHSEGSLTGMIASEICKVKKFISLEGAGRPIGVIILEQLKKQLKGTANENLIPQAKQIIDSLEAGKNVTNVPKLLNNLFRPSVQPYLIKWMQIKPKKEIGLLKIPVLIVQGTTDIQVTMEDAKQLKEGAPKAQLVIMKGMSHILKAGPEDRQANLNTYYDPKLPIFPELIKTMVTFIKS